ncbi:response regulator [Thermodesulfobacteriota bacterium]
MAKILIIDDQPWVSDLCMEGLVSEGHQIFATDDIENVRKKVLSFSPNIVLLNQYLKHGFLVWDVLQDIKKQVPNLPVLIVTEFGTHPFCSRFSQADGYLEKNQTAPIEFRQKISALLGKNQVSREDESHLSQNVLQ